VTARQGTSPLIVERDVNESFKEQTKEEIHTLCLCGVKCIEYSWNGSGWLAIQGEFWHKLRDEPNMIDDERMRFRVKIE
jgi:hypothetical protein